MRWRFIDRITHVEPWQSAVGRKTVSLEEYSLLDAMGTRGRLPETLLVESCVHLARWLVIHSSRFEQTALLLEVRQFSVQTGTCPGSVLKISLTAGQRSGRVITFHCDIQDGALPLARGGVSLSLAPLKTLADPADLRTMWQELHGPA